MFVDGQQEALGKLKRAGELLHQLPHTLHKLCKHGGHLLRVAFQVSTPKHTHVMGTFDPHKAFLYMNTVAKQLQSSNNARVGLMI